MKIPVILGGLALACSNGGSSPTQVPAGSLPGKLVYLGANGFIERVNADGRDRKALVRGNAPRWSPNGSQIAFVRGVPVTPSDVGLAVLICCSEEVFDQIFVMDAEGRGVQQLTTGLNAQYPDWSPDGSEIVFTRPVQTVIDGVPTTEPGLWVMNADGTNPRIVFRGVGSILDVAWSPDGRLIAFSGTLSGQESQDLFVVSPTGTGLRNVTSSPETEGNPAWSPDGQRLAFSDRNNSAVGVIHVGGSDRQLLIENALAPTWSPDGLTIAFTPGEQNQPEQQGIFAADADGDRRRRIAAVTAGHLDWGP